MEFSEILRNIWGGFGLSAGVTALALAYGVPCAGVRRTPARDDRLAARG